MKISRNIRGRTKKTRKLFTGFILRFFLGSEFTLSAEGSEMGALVYVVETGGII